jgi:hypothetical protein
MRGNPVRIKSSEGHLQNLPSRHPDNAFHIRHEKLQLRPTPDIFVTNVTVVPGREWANELSRLHGNSDARKRVRSVILLTVVALAAVIVVVVLALA